MSNKAFKAIPQCWKQTCVPASLILSKEPGLYTAIRTRPAVRQILNLGAPRTAQITVDKRWVDYVRFSQSVLAY